MGHAPRLDPGDGYRAAVVVQVLRFRQPFILAGFLARCLARRCSTVFLVSGIAPVRCISQAAMQAAALLLSPHLVSSSPASRDELLHDSGRKPKNTQTAKKISASYPRGEENTPEENPVSRRPSKSSFGSAATSIQTTQAKLPKTNSCRLSRPRAFRQVTPLRCTTRSILKIPVALPNRTLKPPLKVAT